MSEKETPDEVTAVRPDRRQFLNNLGGGAIATLAAGSIGFEPVLGSPGSTAAAADIGPLTGAARADRAFQLRVAAARRERNVPIPAHPDNADEARFPNRIGNYSKGLRHNDLGEVDPAAYNALRNAIRSGAFADFEGLSEFQGCPDPARQRPFVNPENANAFDIMATDSAQIGTPPSPRFDSAERAAEMVELYWMALLRDVPFDQYASDPTAQAAAADLTGLPGFRGPRDASGRVRPQTLFRDAFPGCTVGPYISQFLIRSVNFGPQFLDGRLQPRAPGVDFMTDFATWLEIQNGCNTPLFAAPAAGPRRFMRDARDLGFYVQIDLLYQAYFVAMLILISGVTDELDPQQIFRFPLNPGNPYGPRGTTRVQSAFASFGNPHISTLAVEPATRALGAVWYQKWRVHRTLRPEVFAGRAEVQRVGRARYPIHPDLFNRSRVLPRIRARYGNYLLSQAFPEGSPLHPAYGSGHAAVAGACVTVLKALFNGDTVFPNPQMVNPADGGQTTVSYPGADRRQMTVSGELNKLASNIAQGRNHSGVHWRSDGLEGIRLGERIGISFLTDLFGLTGEPFGGFRLTKFDGTRVIVRDNPNI